MARPVRVVFGVPFGTRTGGSELLLLTVLRHRGVAGIEPRVLLLEDGTFREEIEALGVPVDVVGDGRGATALPRAIRQARGVLRRERPEVIVSWLPRMQLVLGPAAASVGLRRRVVCWQHVIPDGGWRHTVCFSLPCRLVVTYSRAAAAAQRALRPRRPVHHLWPAIDPPQGLPAEAIAALAGQLGLRDDLPVVGIVGRLIAWKGQVELLQAIGLLRDRGVEAQLLVVGGEDPREHDGTRDRLIAEAQRLGLADRLVLTGQVSDATGHFQLMDVAVNASDPEPFGFVLLEAMALGVPVLAVASGGPAEILEDDRTGALVQSNAPEALVGGLHALLTDPDKRARIAREGRDRFENGFSAQRTVGEIGETLRRVAEGRLPAAAG